MKMSPWRSQGVLQFGVAEVERNSAIQSMVEVDLGASEAEASALWRDLKALAFALHDVVVTDDAWVEEAADTFQITGRRPPNGCGSRGRRAKRRL
jgi:hypothetical protein